MGTFDLLQSAPGLLRAEALNMTLKFERLSDTTGIVTWNIPSPAAGCESNNQAYNGIIITVDNVQFSLKKIPTDGTIYTSDNTVDLKLHVGDKIESALVVGTFYGDKETTSAEITGLTPNTPYYIAGFPVDFQTRYYREGIHAYSLALSRDNNDGTRGKQVIALNVGSANGVQPFSVIRPADVGSGLASSNADINQVFQSGLTGGDFTGLVPGIFYKFKIMVGLIPLPASPIDFQECVPIPIEHDIIIEGSTSPTYQDLINQISKEFALVDNPPKGNSPPGAGGHYFNTKTQIFMIWDGFTHNPIDAIFSDTPPNNIIIGSYWYNTNTNVMNLWDGSTWVVQSIINYSGDPLAPICDETIWFDGTNAHMWNGVSWHQNITFNSIADPSIINKNQCGNFWFDNDSLKKWNDATEVWIDAKFVKYLEDPSNLSNNALWFDGGKLFQWDNTLLTWVELINITVGEDQPANPADGRYWFDPSSDSLQQFNSAGIIWNLETFILNADDPTDRSLIKVWWDDVNNIISVWDDVAAIWIPANNFFNQLIDPTLPPEINEGDFWFNPTTNVLQKWLKGSFKTIAYMEWATDPTNTLTTGQVWGKSDTEFFALNIGGTWDVILPIFSINDPTSLPANTYWYNPPPNELSIWNGVSWVSVAFSINPLSPTKNDEWFDPFEMQLKKWDGVAWINKELSVTVEMNCYGNLEFTDTSIGSLSFIAVTNISLWDSLDVTFTILDPIPGEDAVSTEPSWDELGIGTDGTNDERFKLINEIKYDLGYPVLDVELVPEQMDFAVSRALEEFRYRSSSAYKRGFFFMRVNAETQRYLLSNKIQGMNKIVTVLGVYRLTSAFLSSAHGAGVYGQIVLQHLYNLGTFDLLSYHIMAEYTSLLEILLAGRITFTFNEQTRELWMHHRFPFSENMIAIEASEERSEQDLLNDRWSKSWLRRFATAQAREMLAEIRGKYSSLPGAGGGISLNASELRQRAMDEKAVCYQEIDDYVADRVEEYGFQTQFTFG